MILVAERPIPGLPPDKFKVKENGTFWHYRRDWKKWVAIKPAARDPWTIRFCWRENGKCRSLSRGAGRTVLQAFGISRPIGCECFWKDGNRLNNDLCNLCWEPVGSSRLGIGNKGKANLVKHGKGVFNLISVLDDDDVIEIRRLRSDGMSQKEIAAKFGISVSNVWQIVNGKTWTHLPIGDAHNRRVNRTDDADVRKIRRLRCRGLNYVEIGARFGINPRTVSEIVRGRRRACVADSQ